MPLSIFGPHGKQNELAIRYEGREAKMAAAKGLVNKSLTTVKEVVTPALEQVAINTCPSVPQQSLRVPINYSANKSLNSAQRSTGASIESKYSYGNENSSISRATDWLLRK